MCAIGKESFNIAAIIIILVRLCDSDSVQRDWIQNKQGEYKIIVHECCVDHIHILSSARDQFNGNVAFYI